MLTAEQYRAKLELVLKEIRNFFDVAEIRGNEAGSFIYAEKQKRAVELYQSGKNLIIEFWENEELLEEKEVYSHDKAAEAIIDWMKSNV
jgi:hypothetical protein